MWGSPREAAEGCQGRCRDHLPCCSVLPWVLWQVPQLCRGQTPSKVSVGHSKSGGCQTSFIHSINIFWAPAVCQAGARLLPRVRNLVGMLSHCSGPGPKCKQSSCKPYKRKQLDCSEGQAYMERVRMPVACWCLGSGQTWGFLLPSDGQGQHRGWLSNKSKTAALWGQEVTHSPFLQHWFLTQLISLVTWKWVTFKRLLFALYLIAHLPCARSHISHHFTLPTAPAGSSGTFSSSFYRWGHYRFR